MKAESQKGLQFNFDIRKLILYLEWAIIGIYSLAFIVFLLFQIMPDKIFQAEVLGKVGFAYLGLVWPILLGVVLPASWAVMLAALYLVGLLFVAILGILLGKGRNKLVGVGCLVVILVNLMTFLYFYGQLAQAG